MGRQYLTENLQVTYKIFPTYQTSVYSTKKKTHTQDPEKVRQQKIQDVSTLQRQAKDYN